MNIVGIARRLGPWGRRWGWDHVFRQGAWFAGDRHPGFAAWVREVIKGQSVLELACGDGSLAAEVALVSKGYRAVDVSSEAVRLAAVRMASLVDPIVSFGVGDMAAVIPAPGPTVVIIEEALYYLPAAGRLRLLSGWLSAGARVLVTVHDANKHAATLASCAAAGRIIERRQWGDRMGVLIDAR